MNSELKKEKLKFEKLSPISGGTAVEVHSNAECCKPEGSFKLFEGKEKDWKKDGCPKKCEHCWHLKYDGKFYCDA